MLQANSPAGLHEVLAAHAAKIRIMENQIAELRTLLNEVDVRKALDLVVKAVKTNELSQHDSRIVETERLIEIACEKKFSCIFIRRKALSDEAVTSRL